MMFLQILKHTGLLILVLKPLFGFKIYIPVADWVEQKPMNMAYIMVKRAYYELGMSASPVYANVEE